MLIGLSACSMSPPTTFSPRHQPGQTAYNRPYEVNGRWYHVLPRCAGYVARGIASWYGPGFNGRQTSTGVTYNMYGLTAASKVLPLPCWVRVTNLENGHRVMVKVNDRGPFVANRIIDLSYAAARRLDMIGPGTAIVELQAIDPGNPRIDPLPPRTMIQGAPKPRLYLQVGAFIKETNALHLQTAINDMGLGPAVVHRWPARGALKFYTVRLGPLATVVAVDSVTERMRKVGLKGFRISIR